MHFMIAFLILCVIIATPALRDAALFVIVVAAIGIGVLLLLASAGHH